MSVLSSWGFTAKTVAPITRSSLQGAAPNGTDGLKQATENKRNLRFQVFEGFRFG